MAATFNGEDLIITLESGITEINVQENLYEEWKLWMLAGNMRYPVAFRTIGGDPLSVIINAGSYFFLQNNLGWRIKPPEEDITVYLTGNLAVEDTSLPAFIPTIGTFTAAILGLQPVTQGVTSSMGSQLEQISFDGLVTIDVDTGEAGTGLSISGTPIGSIKTPSNNVIDSKSIASTRGFGTIHINNDITFIATDILDSLIIEGDNSSQSTFTFVSGVTTGNTSFHTACLTGDLSGALFVEDCAMVNVTGVGCTTAISRFTNCSFEGGYVRVRADNDKEIHFVSCENASDDAELDINGSIANVRMIQFAGDLTLTNLTAGNTFVFNTTGGHLVIDSSCTNGTVIIQGDAKWENNGTVTVEDETSASLTWLHSKALTLGKYLGLK